MSAKPKQEVRTTYEELHLRDLLINLLHKLYDKIHQLMLQHLLGMKVRNQKRDIIALPNESVPTYISLQSPLPQAAHTLIGFLLKIKKASARCVKKRVNLWTRIFSISSACLILMLIRTLLILGSMRTRSFSLRATVRGVRSTSGDVCASISGTLWRSEVCDAKLERHRAEVREERTHWR
jgi:hypothetical protein